MLEMVIICLIFGIFIITSFVLGLHYGSKIKNNEKIEVPTINPIKIVKNNMEERKYEKRRDKEELIDEINSFNIDNYNGTGLGQRDFSEVDSIYQTRN